MELSVQHSVEFETLRQNKLTLCWVPLEVEKVARSGSLAVLKPKPINGVG